MICREDKNEKVDLIRSLESSCTEDLIRSQYDGATRNWTILTNMMAFSSHVQVQVQVLLLYQEE